MTVTPHGGNVGTVTADSGNYTATFTIKNTGTQSDTFNLSCVVVGTGTSVGCANSQASPSQVVLTPSHQTTATVTYSGVAPGVDEIGLSALSTYSQAYDLGWDTATVTAHPKPPVVDLTPYNPDDQDYGRCANACFAGTAAFTTVPYFSLGTARAVTLAYNGDRVDLRPIVHVKVYAPRGSALTPTQFWLQIQLKVGVNWVTRALVNGDTTLHYNGSADTVRLGAQFSDSDLTTGVYSIQVVVSSQYGAPWNSVQTATASTRLVVVNERTSRVARGWTIAGLEHLYLQPDSGALVTDGTGSAVYFTHSAPGTWTAPAGDFTSLKLVSGSLVRAYRDSTKLTFNANGLMTQRVDRFGNATAFVYGGDTLRHIRDPLYVPPDTLYRRIDLAYGTNGLSTISDGFGRTTSITVDASKRLTQVADPGGGTTKYKYDASLRLDTVTDRNNKSWPTGYDAYWRVDTVAGPSIPINGGTAARPQTRLVSWQEAGVPLTSTVTTAASPPRVDTVHAKVLDPNGNVTLYTADRWGQVLVTTNPIGQVTTVLRNANGQAVRITSPQGAVDSMAFDATGYMTYSRHGSDLATTYQNGGWGEASQITYGSYTETYTLAAGNGALTAVKNGGTTLKTYAYDGRGRDTLFSDASGHTYKYAYDVQVGQLAADTLPTRLVVKILYDVYGRDTARIIGTQPASVRHYDALNRMTQSIDSIGATPWTFVYDSLRLLQVTNPRGLVRLWRYNAVGAIDSAWNSVQGAAVLSQYNYDKDGHLTAQTNRRSQQITFLYDSLGRMIRDTGPNMRPDTVTYNDAARTVTNSNGIVTETDYLNTLLRPDSTVWRFADALQHAFTIKYHYASTGMRDSVIPVPTVDTITLWHRGYAYVSGDSGRYLVSRVRFNGSATGIGRNLSIWAVADTLPTNTTTVTSEPRSVLNEPLSLHASDSGLDTLVGRVYGTDGLGRVALDENAADTLARRVFRYDQAGRLDSVGYYSAVGQTCTVKDSILGWQCGQTSSADSTLAFTYDALGNRTDHGAIADTLDRLLVFAGDTMKYDADGNDTSRTGNGHATRYSWSADGLLDSVVTDSVHYGYQYDGHRRLVRRLSSGQADRLFLWDGNDLLAEFRYVSGGSLALVAEYSYYSTDRPHAVRTSGDLVRYFVTDALGNVRGTVTAAGATSTIDYGPWGQTEQRSGFGGDTLRPRWESALAEPSTGLYYMRNRWYSTSTGRFISEDPIGLAGGPNLYAFVGDDPCTFSDPFGTQGAAKPACVGNTGTYTTEGDTWGGHYETSDRFSWDSNGPTTFSSMTTTTDALGNTTQTTVSVDLNTGDKQTVTVNGTGDTTRNNHTTLGGDTLSRLRDKGQRTEGRCSKAVT